jgi:hypothetical protein
MFYIAEEHAPTGSMFDIVDQKSPTTSPGSAECLLSSAEGKAWPVRPADVPLDMG